MKHCVCLCDRQWLIKRILHASPEAQIPEGVRLTDPASGKTWSLGDKMMITIVRADVNLGKIDFEVAPAAKV